MRNKFSIILVGMALLFFSFASAVSYPTGYAVQYTDENGNQVDANVNANVNVNSITINPDGTVNADIDVQTDVTGTANGQPIDQKGDYNYKVSGGKEGVKDAKVTGNVQTNTGERIQIYATANQTTVRLNGKEIRANQNATLSNGRKATIRVMPINASAKAIERLSLKVCSTDNNCTIEFKETGDGNNTRIVYVVKADQKVKVLGIFNSNMKADAQVDAETGEVISSKKPWWSFAARVKN